MTKLKYYAMRYKIFNVIQGNPRLIKFDLLYGISISLDIKKPDVDASGSW